MNVSRTKADNAPDAITIKSTRSALGITQRQASIYAKTTLRSWQQWEQGHRLMHPAIWSYFLISTAQLSAKPHLPVDIRDVDTSQSIRSRMKSIWESTHNLEKVRACLADFYRANDIDTDLARWSVAAAMVGADRSTPLPEEMALAVQEMTAAGKPPQETGLWMSYLA